VKAHWKRSPEALRQLLGGEAVGLIIARAKDEQSDEGDEVALCEVGEFYWVHLAHISQKPWYVMCHLLDAGHVTVATLGQHRRASSLKKALNARKLFRDFDPSLRWDIQFYRISTRRRLLGSFVPDRVDLELSEEFSGHMHNIWDPFARKRRKKQQGGWHFDIDAALAEIAEADGCGDLEDCDGPGDSDGIDEAEASPHDEQEVPEDPGEELGCESAEELDVVFNDAPELGLEDVAEPRAGQLAQPRRGRLLAPCSVLAGQPVQADGGPLVLALQHGRLVFYLGRHEFVAECGRHGGRCRRTRALGKRVSASSGKGRPVGMLVAWLAAEASDTESHKWLVWPSHADRVAARASLGDSAGVLAMLACERPRRADEPEEPEEHV